MKNHGTLLKGVMLFQIMAAVASAASAHAAALLTSKNFSGAAKLVADELAAAKAQGRVAEIVFAPGEYRFAELGEKPTFDLKLQGERVIVRGEPGAAERTVLSGEGTTSRAFAFRGSGALELRELTFTRFRNTDPRQQGAALLVSGVARETVTNRIEKCIFIENASVSAGGAAEGGHYHDCRFERNTADRWGALAGNQWRSDPVVAVDCRFIGNVATNYAGAGCGGCYTNCLFEGNVCLLGKAAALGDRCRLDLFGNVFRANEAPLHSEFRGWGSRSYATTYEACGYPAHCELVVSNVVESWGYGRYGRTDGRGVDQVVVRPGESIAAARDYLREHRNRGRRAEIVLADGVHMLTNAVDLIGFDSELTVRAEHPGRAIVVGGWNFRGRDFVKSAERPGLLEIVVPEWCRTNLTARLMDGDANPLERGSRPANPLYTRYDRWRPHFMPLFTVDTKAMIPGRWPKGGRFFFGAESNIVRRADRGGLTNALYTTHTGRELTWDWEGANIFAWGRLDGCAWTLEAWSALGIDPETKAIDFGRRNLCNGTHFFLANILEETDEPGEWCYQAKTGKLFFCPGATFNDDSLCVMGTHWDHFFCVRADAVRFEGLVFTGKTGCYALCIADGHDCRISGCRFSGLAFRGVYVKGERNRIESCDFEDIQSTAAEVSGGEKRDLVRGDNVIDNCTFRNCTFGQIGGHAPAVGIGGCGNRVSHNDIRDAIGPGIGFGGPDNVIEYNRIVNVTTDDGDSSSIGSSGTSAYGSVIRFNDVGGSPGFSQGIYVDDFGCGARIYGNVVRNVSQFGLFFGGGRDNIVSNNIVTATWGGVHTDNRGLFWPAWRDQAACWEHIKQEFGLPTSAFAKKFPQILGWEKDLESKMLTAPIGNEFVNNLFLDLPGYSSSCFTCLNRHFDHSRNYARGNLAVRSRGIPPGGYDLASGVAELAPTNSQSEGTKGAFGPYFEVRVLDGTAEEPIDLGFRKVPKMAFDLSDCMFLQQGWLDNSRFNAARAAGRFDDIAYEEADFNLKPDARIFKEIPGFQPIPWDEIGPYVDKWRKSVK